MAVLRRSPSLRINFRYGCESRRSNFIDVLFRLMTRTSYPNAPRAKTQLLKSVASSLLIIVALMASSQMIGCETDYKVAQSSTQGGDGYVEEPLTEWSESYSAALNTSNKFVDAFSAGQLRDLRALLDPRLSEDVSDATLAEFRDKMIATYGPVIEYKPMQWSFAAGPEGYDYLYSVKIVVHEKQPVYYLLKFEADSAYDRILGFVFRNTQDGASVNQVAMSALKNSRESE